MKLGAALPLNFIVPAPVIDNVPLPLPIVTEFPKVIVPVVTLMTSVATSVLFIQLTVPFTVKEPVVTATLPIHVAVLVAPLKVKFPATLQVPAFTASWLITAAPGWLIVKSPDALSVSPKLKVSVLANVLL